MKNTLGTSRNSGDIDVNNGERTKIDEAAYGVLMDMLSGIYANAAEAVLREYSVNGWDEHRKYGVERPVEVSLPSVLQPTLRIRDFGAGGLAAEQVMDVFGTYGKSSKRDSDEEVGGFGIGSKAAFALGHQFMVTGYKDGQKFTALFTLNDDGTGTKTILFEGPTDEPNGVEVSLGVDDIDAMRESAERFFSFWDRGHVLVDGEEPTPIFERLEKINDEIYLDPNGRGEAFAVMGPVPYPVDRALLRKVSAYLEKADLGEAASLPTRLIDSGTDLYLRVPIGGVIPAPSREALRDKQTTVNTLGSIFLGLHQDSVLKVQTEVAKAPTYYAAVKTFNDLNTSLGAFKVDRKSVSWNGKRMRKTVPVDMRSYTLHTKSWRSSTMVVGVESHVPAIDFEDAEKTITVVGVPESQWGSVQRFVKRYLEQNESGVKRVFVTAAESVSFEWFQVGIQGGARSVTLDGWREILKGMRQSSPRTVNEPSYSTGFTRASRDVDERDLLSEILEWGKDIVIFHESATGLNRFQKAALEDYTPVVLLATQSEDALVKRVEAAANDEENPSDVKIVPFEDVNKVAQANAQAIVDTFTDEEKEAAGARVWLDENKYEINNLRESVDALAYAGEVTSPALLGFEDTYALAHLFADGLTQERVQEVAEALAAVSGRGRSFSLPEEYTVEYSDSLPSLGDLYPLVTWSDVRNAARNLRRQKREDGTFDYTWSFTQKRQKHDETLLAHALEYVNSH